MTRRLLVLALSLGAAVSSAGGAIPVMGDKLALDMLAQSRLRWQQSLYMGFVDTRSDFFRPEAYLGLTGQISPIVTVRAYAGVTDLSESMLRDLFIDFRWPLGWNLRVGQFTPPLSSEALTDPASLRLIGYSFLSRYWKPWNQRDVGVQAGFLSDVVDFSAALLNGYGIGQGYEDNNKWKDLCLRVALRPLLAPGGQIAARGYYGRVNQDVEFTSGAVELSYVRARLFSMAECQYTRQGTVTRTSLQAVSSYRFPQSVRPVARVQVEFQPEDRYDFGAAAGLTVFAFGDRVQFAVQYHYRLRQSRRVELRVTEHRMLLQLQGSL